MSWNRRLRMGRTSAVGALAAAGVAGTALLAGPMASSQAAGLFGTYYDGGFCYQNKIGKENVYRLQVSEPNYDPAEDSANLSFVVQKWDDSSGRYQDERLAFTNRVDKSSLGGYYRDPDMFCNAMTRDRADQYLGGYVYNYGEWTSTRTPVRFSSRWAAGL